MFKNLAGESGVTLIDVAIALALLAIALAAAGALATLSSRVGAEAGRRSQAVELASGELEALHNYRDRQAKQSLLMTPDYFATSKVCPTQDALIMALSGTPPNQSWLPVPVAGVIPVSYTAAEVTPQLLSNGFSRLISLCDTGDPNIKTVEVSVYWTEPNGPVMVAGTSFNRRVVLRSILSNWAGSTP